MADYNNILTGLNIPSQLPLDPKKTKVDEATLAYLGINDNLAYTYFEQMEVICIQEASRWVWREVGIGEENTGLCPVDFTYPDAQATYGIDYSGRTFNFFQLNLTGPQGPAGTNGVAGSVWRNGTGVPSNGLGVNGDYYLDDNTGNVYLKAGGTYSIVANIKGPVGPIGLTGLTGLTGTTEVLGSPSILVIGTGIPTADPYEVSAINLQDTTKTSSFTLTNADDKKTFFINNLTENIQINVPTGLIANFHAMFYQLGTGTISFIASGTTIRYPSVFTGTIRSRYDWALIEKIENTEIFQLSGRLAFT